MTVIRRFLTDREGSPRIDLSLLLSVFGFAYFFMLGHLPLIEPDEGRYAEIPREMLQRGDFVTPYLNFVKYFEKPPLHYWLNAVAMSVFGENEFSARFPGALMGLLTILLVYHVGRRLFGRQAGLFAALILGTATGFLVQARLNITDMTLTCTLSAALAFFAVAAREGEERKGLYYHASYVAAGLAVLAKGLIGIVFPGAIVFLYLLLSRRWRLLREMRLATGIPLFLGVTAPWFLLVSLRNPEFAWFFFIHEHFERYLTTVHGRFQPFWFFLPVLAGTMLPWSFFVPAALRGGWRDRQSKEGDSRLYLAIWAVFIFLFFSKSDSKLVPYILPVFPALALLMGNALAKAVDGDFRPVRLQGFVLSGVLAVLGAGLILYPHLAPRPQLAVAGATVLGLLFLGEGVCAFLACRKGNAATLLVGLALFSFTIGIVGPPFILDGIAEKKSVKEFGLRIHREAAPDAVVASFGVSQGLSFYAQRRIMVVGDRNELEFGSKQGDQAAWFVDITAFRRIWGGNRQVFLFLRRPSLTTVFDNASPPYRIIAEARDRLLVTNR
jgi:4-amino-4-deoxy-L-arabinose transferase-like glycosyltransferase